MNLSVELLMGAGTTGLCSFVYFTMFVRLTLMLAEDDKVEESTKCFSVLLGYYK